MITVEGSGFLKDGQKWIPTGMNTSGTGVKNRGGYSSYMQYVANYGVDCIRIHIPGTVNKVCDPYTCKLTDECIAWIEEIGDATRANGISLIPMPFPNEFSWKYHPLCSRFSWIYDWYVNGRDATKLFLDNLYAKISEYWDIAYWEIINEVHVRDTHETTFICDICDYVKSIQPSPISVSFDQQNTTLSAFGRQVIDHVDIVNAHTYVSDVNLSWFPTEENNEWVRMDKMINNVLTICEVLKASAGGKPFLSSEDPLYVMWGPFVNFIRGIIGKPQNKDIAQNFYDRSITWVDGGAAMPGIMWGMAYGDYPEHILSAVKAVRDYLTRTKNNY